MPTPSLRILVVDDQPAQRLSIEKMLNWQGYHRIAPVTCFAELLVLIEHAIEPFDLLVINSSLAMQTTFNLDNFFRFCPAIRHTLIYDGMPPAASLTVVAPSARVITRLSRAPDNEVIKNLMQMIDPHQKKPVRRACLRWVP